MGVGRVLLGVVRRGACFFPEPGVSGPGVALKNDLVF